MHIRILVDNVANGVGLASEHGFSAWINADGQNILFDTGMGEALPGNAASLGVDLSQTDTIVLSHGHYDHTGGLPHVLGAVNAPIYMHPAAVEPRYRQMDSAPHKAIGMAPSITTMLTRSEISVVHTDRPTRISDHVWVTGPIPRHTTFEDTGGPFFLDEVCRISDPITDDQALWIETAEGIVLLLGCAHSGVVNTMDYIAELTNATEIRAVIGGMHLLNASEQRLRATSEAITRYRIKYLSPCHCTGELPVKMLAAQFPAQYVPVTAGYKYPTD